MIKECREYRIAKEVRKRYSSDSAASTLLSKRIRKAHAAGLLAPHCSPAQTLRPRDVIASICAGAKSLGLRYVKLGTRSFWDTKTDALENERIETREAAPTPEHANHLLGNDRSNHVATRSPALEDVVLFAEACGMCALSFELPGGADGADPLFDRHLELRRAGVLMHKDGINFLRDYLFDDRTSKFGFRVFDDKDSLKVHQKGDVHLAPLGVAPEEPDRIQIYLDKQYYWVTLHQPPKEFLRVQAYCIDEYPPYPGQQPGAHMAVYPVPCRELTENSLRLERLSLDPKGPAGKGKMAVVLVHEDDSVLKNLPFRIDTFCKEAEKAHRDAPEAETFAECSKANAERLKWLVMSLNPERLWLARRPYELELKDSRRASR